MFTKEFLQEGILNPLLENLVNYKELILQFLMAIAIIIATWIVAKIVQIIIRIFLRIIHFDKFSDKTGFTKFLEHGGLHNIPSTTIGNLFYWIIMFVGFTVAVNIFTAQSAFQIVDRLILYIPHALLALFIFIIGMAIAVFLSRILQGAIVRAGIRERVAGFLQMLLFGFIAVFALLLGLTQLKVKDDVIAIVIENALRFIFLGLAIAFGLGGRYMASDVIASFKLRQLYPKGSEVEYDNVKGVLKEVGWFDSLVYTQKGIINIPNSSLARKIIKRKI
ncbi:MAG: hypothetical protein JW827_03415 [Spirochaetes bacterium]|nr:hypothetical protein [Spirochaetota bacterium]